MRGGREEMEKERTFAFSILLLALLLQILRAYKSTNKLLSRANSLVPATLSSIGVILGNGT
jgi:hypothetical protein